MAEPEIARSRLPVSVVALSAAIGVFMASSAYTLGRLGYSNSPWANRAYWLGQALVMVPVAVRLLGRRDLTANATVTLLLTLTTAEYILKICYSPVAFTFTDELLHWRSAVNLLQTGKLFTPNYSFPIGPRYPGLEELVSSFSSVTGFSIFTSGLIVAGVAHLLFVCSLYLLYRSVSRSHRIAGIAILIYSSTSDLTSFDSMFVYETLALAFMGLAVLATWRAAARRSPWERTGWFTIAALTIMGTTVTHHVTSYMLTAVLVLATITSLLGRYRRSAVWLATLALIAGASVVCWVIFVAPETISYFQPTVEGVLQGFRALTASGQSSGPTTSGGPLGNQALAGLTLLAISAVLPIGWWEVWRYYRHRPWITAMAFGSLSWYVIIAVRLGTADGSELAGRSSVFVYIPVSIIVAFALTRLVTATALRLRKITAAAVIAGALTLLFNGLANGWPPFWERLPGTYQVGAFERSVVPDTVAAAQWTLANLGPGNRFAADFGNFTTLASYGYQNPIRDVAYLYSSRTYTTQISRHVRAQALQYILVDRRLSQALPASGKYFYLDPNAGRYTHPLPIANLEKFNNVRGVARIYDSGNIVVYELGWAHHAP